MLYYVLVYICNPLLTIHANYLPFPSTNEDNQLCWLSSCFAIVIPMNLGKVLAALSL